METTSETASISRAQRPYALIVVAVVGWLGALVLGPLLWQSIQTGKQQAAQIEAAQQMIADLTGQVNALGAERDDLQTRLDDARQSASELQSQLDAVKADYNRSRNDVSGLQADLNESKAEVERLNQALLCEQHPDSGFRYTNNSSVSEQLKTWVGDTFESVSKAEWEVIWNNARTSIHRLTGDHMYVFIVDYEDTNLGLKDSVYYVNRSCFLDHR